MGNYIEKSERTNAEKVTRCVIVPMHSLWGYEMDEYSVRAFIDELRFYDEDTLNGAMRSLRTTSEKRPTLVKIIKACNEMKDRQKSNAPIKTAPLSLNQIQISSVMTSFIGQKAFEEGYWWQLYEFLSMKATSTFITDEQLETIKAEASRANDEELERKVYASPEPFRSVFIKFHDTMVNRKAAVLYRYGKS